MKQRMIEISKMPRNTNTLFHAGCSHLVKPAAVAPKQHESVTWSRQRIMVAYGDCNVWCCCHTMTEVSESSTWEKEYLEMLSNSCPTGGLLLLTKHLSRKNENITCKSLLIDEQPKSPKCKRSRDENEWCFVDFHIDAQYDLRSFHGLRGNKKKQANKWEETHATNFSG